jgi:hypothetical protein
MKKKGINKREETIQQQNKIEQDEEERITKDKNSGKQEKQRKKK